MAKNKSGDFNKDGIESIANDNPVVYKILDDKGYCFYTGSAKRGSVKDRLKEHLPGGSSPTYTAYFINLPSKALRSIQPLRMKISWIIPISRAKF